MQEGKKVGKENRVRRRRRRGGGRRRTTTKTKTRGGEEEEGRKRFITKGREGGHIKRRKSPMP